MGRVSPQVGAEDRAGSKHPDHGVVGYSQIETPPIV